MHGSGRVRPGGDICPRWVVAGVSTQRNGDRFTYQVQTVDEVREELSIAEQQLLVASNAKLSICTTNNKSARQVNMLAKLQDEEELLRGGVTRMLSALGLTR